MVKITKIADIQVYEESKLLVKEIYQLAFKLLTYKDYSLVDQIKRAAMSIPANIAEGYGRKTRKDFSKFLSIALGSTNEVMAFLDIVDLIYPNIKSQNLK